MTIKTKTKRIRTDSVFINWKNPHVAARLARMVRVVSVAAVFAALAAVVFYLRLDNPDLANREVKIFLPGSQAEHFEKYVNLFKKELGDDMQGYVNHCYRVLSYTVHYLGGNETFVPQIATALAFHDLGLWSDDALRYLEPSLERAAQYVGKLFSKDDLDLINNIIYLHHKITPFHGTHEDVVNAAIKADLLDFSLGLANHGMPYSHVRKVNAVLPNAGFHVSLARLLFSLEGWNIPKAIYELSSIFKW